MKCGRSESINVLFCTFTWFIDIYKYNKGSRIELSYFCPRKLFVRWSTCIYHQYCTRIDGTSYPKCSSLLFCIQFLWKKSKFLCSWYCFVTQNRIISEHQIYFNYWYDDWAKVKTKWKYYFHRPVLFLFLFKI